MLWPLVRKTIRDHWKLTIAWLAGLVLMATAELWAYTFMAKAGPGAQQFIESFPESMRKMFRMEEYFSGPGFLGTELFSFMVQLSFIAIASSFGAAATAGEEDRGTADVLFSLPVRRAQVLASKLIAMLIALTTTGIVFIAFLWLTMPLADMQAAIANVAAATFNCAMLGLVCGSCALLVGALTGKRGLALGVAIGVAIASFLIYSLAPMIDALDTVVNIVPWQWAMGADPLNHGLHAPHVALLLGSATLLIAAAAAVFGKRDLAS